ncbi:MAG: S8 family serine peptidase [Planctomycetota bacterium]
MHPHPLRLSSGAALAAFVAGTAPLGAQGTVEPYGCDADPKGGLTHVDGTPAPGATLTLAVRDARGAPALALLATHSAPAPGYPCGTPLPGLGELLLDLDSPGLPTGPAQLLAGPGRSASFALAIPAHPALAGAVLYSQGAVVGFDEAAAVRLTGGLRIELGSGAPPDLAVRSIAVDSYAVSPGETARARVVVRNQGGASGATTLALSDSAGWDASAELGPLASGAVAVVELSLPTDRSDARTNPHFLTAVVDPDNRIAEASEDNNQGTARKPVFVVEPILVEPAPVYDHDEVFEVAGNLVTSYTRHDYGPAGAPAASMEAQPDKGPAVLSADAPAPQPRVAEAVAAEDARAAEGEVLRYVVKYRHDVPMPVLPDLNARFGRFAPENLSQLELRIAMFEGVRRARVEAAAELVDGMRQVGAEAVEFYTLAGAMLVDAPKGALAVFADHPQVQHVEVEEEAVGPPASIADGRELINTDPYFSGGATGVAFTALLDTGIFSAHTLFNGPDHILFEEDCVNGDKNCNDDGDPDYDPSDDCSHGTSTASILTGNTNLGNASRGVTGGSVDSWDVYNNCGLKNSAVHRGFDEAIFWGDKVIVAEMQSTQGPSGSIADDADDAFDAGSCTIAANGNNGPSAGTVNSPANAHKAIGVGAYDTDTLVNYNNQSRGPTSDDRIKPDIQAPNNVQAAGDSFLTDLDPYGGTSCATPFAAGAASVYADWFNQTSLTSATTGKIYAALINSGPNDFDVPFDNQEGAGKFALPLGGKVYMGSRTLKDGESKSVTISVPSGTDSIAAAIWWPENPIQTHRDIDLYLEKPDGSTSDSSTSVPSVFEHVRVGGSIATGSRDVRIEAYSIPWLKSQTVYYAIFVK